MTLQLKKLPAFVRDAYAKYFASWDIYKAGNGPRPSKQKQVAVPDVPNFSVLMEHTGALNWRSSYVDPMSGERTCLLHGSLETISLSEATALHVDLEAMVAEGRSPRSAKLTVSQAFYNLVVPNSEKKRKKTLKEDIGKFKNEFERSIGHWKLGQIKPFMLRQEAERLRSKKNKATAERYVACLRGIFRDFVELGLLATNPASGLKILAVQNARNVIATDDQLEKLGAVIALNPSKENDFFLGLMVTGARESELRNARFDDIDESRGVLRIHDSKTGGPQDVLLTKDFMPILERRKAARRNGYLFPGQKEDKPMSYPKRAFKRLLEQAGVSGLTPHDFRRGFGTAGIQSPGVSVHDVSKLLRHSSTRVTETHYLVAVDSRLRHAADLAGQAIYQRLGLHRHLRLGLRPSVRSIVITRQICLITSLAPAART